MLKNPVYIAIRRYKDDETGQMAGKEQPGCWEPIIDIDLFKAVQEAGRKAIGKRGFTPNAAEGGSETHSSLLVEVDMAPRITSCLNTRTPVFTIVIKLPSALRRMKKGRIFRNTIFVALELQAEMKRDGISQADLARGHGLSRARVHQWLTLLESPKREIDRLKVMGDHWEKRLVTERMLRR